MISSKERTCPINPVTDVSAESAGDLPARLREFADPDWIPVEKRFYRDPDRHVFWGVRKTHVSRVAREFSRRGRESIRACLESDVHELRSLGLRILRLQFDRGDDRQREGIFAFYLDHRRFVSEWDLVDESAPYIAGKYLWGRDCRILSGLAASRSLWDRRIAIVSSWWFIRQGHVDTTFRLTEQLLSDPEDLIHKACGWMLREAGKVDSPRLVSFLGRHHRRMPRVMLRYAIERLAPGERKVLLKKPPSAEER